MLFRRKRKAEGMASKKGLVREQGLVKPSLIIRGTAPRARPKKVWPAGKPPGGKIEVKRLPDGRLSFKPIED